MSNRHDRAPGLDLFWEQADIEANDDHPLVRELRHRIDAIARYQQMIGDAESMGAEAAVEHLSLQCAREEALARRLRAALRAMQ